MAKTKKTQTEKKENTETNTVRTLKEKLVSPRGHSFKGTVVKKFTNRVVIEFTRTVYVKKYQRFYRKSTRIHAYLPQKMESEIQLGDYIEVQECRPLSKITNAVVIKKIRSAEVKK